MALVTSKTKAMHDKKHMDKMAGKKEESMESNPFHGHIQAAKATIKAYESTHKGVNKSSHNIENEAYKHHSVAHTAWSALGKEYEPLSKDHKDMAFTHKENLSHYDRANPDDPTVMN
jgi:hypothetical protein